eukprot:CAMPEP_0198196786 /NCGR_PEP_ID=MMETSP1445-20131203/227_1 /TAXON_ID=36898 /ORGANISM="Pyramimonas sp., Strain CCMP2087" /LENGTH=184 /DNA_ID=CAMNT_0043865769 /DNA_START=47 /DNA_END=598 /DNA_ORIENTATION=+
MSFTMNVRTITPACGTSGMRKVTSVHKGVGFAGKPLSICPPSPVTMRITMRTRATSEEEAPVQMKTLEYTASPTEEVAPTLLEGIRSVSGYTNRGFTAGDSAGQSNIFSIEPKMYVASEDNGDVGEGNDTFQSAAVALVALVLIGVVAASKMTVSVDDSFAVGGGESLTSLYRELSPGADKPKW